LKIFRALHQVAAMMLPLQNFTWPPY